MWVCGCVYMHAGSHECVCMPVQLDPMHQLAQNTLEPVHFKQKLSPWVSLYTPQYILQILEALILLIADCFTFYWQDSAHRAVLCFNHHRCLCIFLDSRNKRGKLVTVMCLCVAQESTTHWKRWTGWQTRGMTSIKHCTPTLFLVLLPQENRRLTSSVRSR